MAAEISVQSTEYAEGWTFAVVVTEDGKATTHEVWLTRTQYERLAYGVDPEVLVRASFEFLLEREPRESIMQSFELNEIGRYFPDWERQIRWRIRQVDQSRFKQSDSPGS
jgi:hypothetical protein